jgi:hypothetical protein
VLKDFSVRIAEQQLIREKAAAVVLEWANSREPPFTGETPDGFADAIVAAHLVADEARLGLHRWIDAARRTGLSWAEIGDALGISKQAAQQRFRSLGSDDDLQVLEGEEIVRFGATAFNEMSMLRTEGRKGHELIRTGALTLVFRPTSHAWEYRRRIGADAMIREMDKAGWTYVSSWIPFHYFKRPIEDEPI